MAATHESLPRDANGIVQGAYRLLHEDPTFHGDIGVFEVRDGAATSPACGRALICALGEYGSQLYLEPWGELPGGFLMPEMVSAEVSPEVAATLAPCPWRAVTEKSDDADKAPKGKKSGKAQASPDRSDDADKAPG